MPNSFITLKSDALPTALATVLPPLKQLHVLGNANLLSKMNLTLAVVGSRSVSPYGRQVTTQLVEAAAGQGVVIVSGLALGVDSIAHRAALNVDGQTIAVLPGGIERIYPASHHQLAQQILQQGGAVVSEDSSDMRPQKRHFIGRNRLIAGLARATLITEAAKRSGSLHTAQFALEQGREVIAVPGSITSATSVGTNELIKSGAMVVTGAHDLLDFFGVKSQTVAVTGDSPAEQLILDLLQAGPATSDQLLQKSQLPIQEFNQLLTIMELSKKVSAVGRQRWSR